MADDIPNLFDYLAAELARDAGIAQVATALDPYWDKASQWAIRHTAMEYDYFTSDDVWALLHSMAIPAPAEPRAMGYALQRAQRDGICRTTGNFMRSARPVAHCRPMMIWHSLLWTPQQ